MEQDLPVPPSQPAPGSPSRKRARSNERGTEGDDARKRARPAGVLPPPPSPCPRPHFPPVDDRDKDRDKDRDRDRDRERDRDRDREREREREKEKERERERHRDKERERDRDRQRDRERDRERERERERDRPRKGIGPPPSPSHPPDLNERKEERREEPKDGGDAFASLKELDLSEMNKLRLQLGLKPLQEDRPAPAARNMSREREERTKEKVAALDAKAAGSEALEDRIRAMKEKKALLERERKKARSLGDAEEEQDAAQWAERARRLAEEKRKAEERARLLAAQTAAEAGSESDSESDEDGWVPQSVREAKLRRKAPSHPKAAAEEDVVGGLRVAHEVTDGDMLMGQVLVLKDRPILAGKGPDLALDEDEDELESHTIAEQERRAKAERERTKKYNPYDPDAPLLVQYEEEKVRKGALTVDASGRLHAASDAPPKPLTEEELEARRTGRITGAQEPRLASAFATREELAAAESTFKKKKKRVGGSARTRLADQLVPLGEADAQHLATREERNERQRQANIADVVATLQKRESYQAAVKRAHETAVEDAEEEDDPELRRAINRARQAASTVRPEEDVAARVEQTGSLSTIKTDEEGSATFNAAAEFVRTIPTRPGAAAEEDDELLSVSERLARRRLQHGRTHQPAPDQDVLGYGLDEKGSSRQEEKKRWRDRAATGEAEAIGDAMDLELPAIKAEPASILGGERSANVGLAATLSLLRAAGASKVIDQQEVVVGRKADARFTDDEVRGDLVHLEYVDAQGRPLTKKEAFRQMAYKFHGQGAGKESRERRQAQVQEDLKRKAAALGDEALGSMAALKTKQAETSLPYSIVQDGHKLVEENRQRLLEDGPTLRTLDKKKAVRKEKK